MSKLILHDLLSLLPREQLLWKFHGTRDKKREKLILGDVKNAA